MENKGVNYRNHGVRNGHKGYRLSDVSRPLTFSGSGFCLNASTFATRIARRSAAALRRNSVACVRQRGWGVCVLGCLRSCVHARAPAVLRVRARDPLGSACVRACVRVLARLRYSLARACADSCMGVSECGVRA
jgi:hypothetical protein